MYNLLMSGHADAWDTGSFEFDQGRVINANEYTDEDLVKRFGSLDETAIAEIIKLPALFAHENAVNRSARLGWITRIRARQGKVRIDFQFDPSGAYITPEKLIEMRWDLDIGEWEVNRHHWALKNVDLFEAMGEAGLIDLKRLPGSAAAQQAAPHFEVRPRIFRIPAQQPDPSLVSVMMPYAGFDAVHEALRRAALNAGFKCERADKFWEESELIQDIFSLIYRSRYVICDFTGSNPNVFYEAGIAHTLGREVIPIAQNTADVPFDLRHHRYIQYHNNQQGHGELSEKVQKRLEFLKRRDA